LLLNFSCQINCGFYSGGGGGAQYITLARVKINSLAGNQHDLRHFLNYMADPKRVNRIGLYILLKLFCYYPAPPHFQTFKLCPQTLPWMANSACRIDVYGRCCSEAARHRSLRSNINSAQRQERQVSHGSSSLERRTVTAIHNDLTPMTKAN